RFVLLDPEPGARGQPARPAVPDGPGDPEAHRRRSGASLAGRADRHLPQPVAPLGGRLTFYLRRSEELSPEELQQRLAENPREAARLILAAARESELEAQALLGQILLDGQGIQRDPALAITWFRIAAERGQPMARNM